MLYEYYNNKKVNMNESIRSNETPESKRVRPIIKQSNSWCEQIQFWFFVLNIECHVIHLFNTFKKKEKEKKRNTQTR